MTRFQNKQNIYAQNRENPIWKPQLFYNLLRMTSHQFFHGLFVESEPISPVHTQGEQITKGHEYQEVGIIGSQLRDYLPKTPLKNFKKTSTRRRFVVHIANKETLSRTHKEFQESKKRKASNQERQATKNKQINRRAKYIWQIYICKVA